MPQWLRLGFSLCRCPLWKTKWHSCYSLQCRRIFITVESKVSSAEVYRRESMHVVKLRSLSDIKVRLLVTTCWMCSSYVQFLQVATTVQIKTFGYFPPAPINLLHK